MTFQIFIQNIVSIVYLVTLSIMYLARLCDQTKIMNLEKKCITNITKINYS